MNSLSPKLLALILLFGSTVQAKKEKPAHMVESEKVEWRTFQQRKTIHCQLVYAQQRKIYSPEVGQIKQLRYEVGDRVKQNALLLTFNPTALKLEQKKTALARQQATLELQRRKKLQQQNAIATDELNRAKTVLKQAQIESEQLQTRLSQQRLYAPFDAIITQRLVEIGDNVSAHKHLLTLIAPHSLHVTALLEEALFLQLKPKQAVKIQLSNQTQQNAHISRLHPTLDANHQGKIEVRFERLPNNLFAGQRCQLQLNINHTNILSVPLHALRHDRQGAYLWIINAQQKTERQSVITGRYFSERIEIQAGLKEQEHVVTKGFLGLKNHQSVIDLKENSSQENMAR